MRGRGGAGGGGGRGHSDTPTILDIQRYLPVECADWLSDDDSSLMTLLFAYVI